MGTALAARWRALAACLLCMLAVLGFGVSRGRTDPAPGAVVGHLTPGATPGYAGSASCAGCHAAETAAWSKSQHSRAMQPASAETVLGDFNDAKAEHFGSKARFL